MSGGVRRRRDPPSPSTNTRTSGVTSGRTITRRCGGRVARRLARAPRSTGPPRGRAPGPSPARPDHDDRASGSSSRARYSSARMRGRSWPRRCPHALGPRHEPCRIPPCQCVRVPPSNASATARASWKPAHVAQHRHMVAERLAHHPLPSSRFVEREDGIGVDVVDVLGQEEHVHERLDRGRGVRASKRRVRSSFAIASSSRRGSARSFRR